MVEEETLDDDTLRDQVERGDRGRFTNSFEPSGRLHQAIAGRASRIARCSAVLASAAREPEAFMIG
jgi:hypothetical protein